jgi:CRISPR-associated protein Csm5
MEIKHSEFKIQNIKIKLHILSPVHIGCDDVYEPMHFVIDPDRKKLIDFDPLHFIKLLNKNERVKLMNIVNKGNIASIIELYRFISEKRREIKGREIDIAEEIINRYKKVKSLKIENNKKLKQELNNFIISRTAYSPYNNLPYIPGSSLKGALRTAYLSHLAKKLGIREWYKSKGDSKNMAKDLENKLLGGSFSSDPFRMIKVTDLQPIGDTKVKIVYAINRKKEASSRPTRAEIGPKPIFETVQPGSIFEGFINIETPVDNSGIKTPILREDLFNSLKGFYNPKLENEVKMLKSIGIRAPLINHLNSYFKGRIGKTVFLIRIGRHSGAEAVTIDGNRNIKIIQGKKYSYKDHATTIWLASDKPKPDDNTQLLPFGWSVLEVIE